MSVVQERGRKLTRRGRRNIERQLKQLDKQRRKLAKQAAKRAKDARKQLPGQRSGPLETARDTVKETTSNVGQTLAAVGAATVAAAAPLIERARSGELTEQVRERAAELTERVREDVLPRVSELATTGVEAGRTALQNLASSDAAERAGELAEEAPRLARRGGSAVTTAAGRAVGATGYALKETTLIAFWATALGTLVYYTLLNDEQREKVASTAQSLYQQAQELIRDFQGYDEEF